MALTKAKFGVISSALASGNATDGYVLTADGSGNSAWEEAAGGVAGISSSADTTAITIDSSERVGIGLTSPTNKLVVGGTEAADTTYLRLQNIPATAATHKVAMEFWGNEGTANNGTYNMGRIYGEFDGSSYTDTRLTLGSASGNGTFNDEVNIKNGNVAIGTTNAFGTTSNRTVLSVNGTNSATLNIGTGGTQRGFLFTEGSYLRLSSLSSFPLSLGVDDTERMRIISTGQILIGKTAINQTTTTGHEFSTGTTVYRTDFSVSNNEFMIFNNHSSPAGTASLSFRYNNSQKGSIGLTSTTVSYNSNSDYRLKENIVTDWDATTRLKQLKPSRFNWISDADTTVDGFLAHEVSDIVPEAITGEKDATKTLSNVVLNSDNQVIGEDVSEDDWTAGKADAVLWAEEDELPEGVSVGDVKTPSTYPSDSTWEASHTVPVYQVIDQSKLVPLLVKTIQELEARITTLENA